MKIASVADVKARLSAYLEECEMKGPVVITRNGKAVAVLLAPVDDDDLERLLLARSPRFQALLDKSRRSIQSGRGLSRKEFWRAVRQRYPRPASPNRSTSGGGPTRTTKPPRAASRARTP